jgi:hypothetical protein
MERAPNEIAFIIKVLHMKASDSSKAKLLGDVNCWA